MEGGEDKEVNITYEILFDILRNEKNRPELQKLPDNFFQDLVKYLTEKRELIEGPQKEGIFAAEERQKASMQLKSIKRLLTELYSKREKKIIGLALDKSQIKSDVDITSLLNEERMLFEQLVTLFDKNRESILLKILEGALPSFEQASEQTADEQKAAMPQTPVEQKAMEQKTEETSEAQTNNEQTAVEPEEKMTEKETTELYTVPSTQPRVPKQTKMVRFLYAVPKFIGKELETYGPFEEEDITTLPAEIADILIAKGRAEEIEQE